VSAAVSAQRRARRHLLRDVELHARQRWGTGTSAELRRLSAAIGAGRHRRWPVRRPRSSSDRPRALEQALHRLRLRAYATACTRADCACVFGSVVVDRRLLQSLLGAEIACTFVAGQSRAYGVGSRHRRPTATLAHCDTHPDCSTDSGLAACETRAEPRCERHLEALGGGDQRWPSSGPPVGRGLGSKMIPAAR
jgi:hypothetical protein